MVSSGIYDGTLSLYNAAFSNAVQELSKSDSWDFAVASSLSTLDQVIKREMPAHYRSFYTSIVPHFARITFDELVQSQSRDLIDDWIAIANDWIQSYAGGAIKGISNTVQRVFSSLLLQLRYENTGGPREIARIISTRIPELSRARALVWTRTELITGSNVGAHEGARSSGLRMDKEWSTSIDGRERPWHGAAHGQRVGFDEYYTVDNEKLLYPAHPDASLRNRINCRCASIYIPLDY